MKLPKPLRRKAKLYRMLSRRSDRWMADLISSAWPPYLRRLRTNRRLRAKARAARL